MTTPTPPSDVRTGLTVVTAAAVADARTVAAAGSSAEEVRATLFVAAPLIVADYSDGTAALALDWYEELREAARVTEPYSPTPIRLVTDEDVRAAVAAGTAGLRGVPDEVAPDAIETALQLVGGSIVELVADGFRDTMTGNSEDDPAAVGWRRFARPGACKFCRMLADKGAVFTEKTARFAAHGAVMNGGRKGGNCMCIAAPAFDEPGWTEATPMQYLASKRVRSAEEKARLRDYLNENYPSDGKPVNKPPSQPRKAASPKPSPPTSGFDAMTIAQLEAQLRILEGLPDSKYKTTQGDRIRKRLAQLR